MAKLFLTGVTGFLGSHLAATWLRQNPDHHLLALIRADSPQAATHRLHQALRTASQDQGLEAPDPALLARARAVAGDLVATDWAADPMARDWWGGGHLEVIHSAAYLSFREQEREEVFRINVSGTRSLLEALATLPAPRVFNHISTAYVAGHAEGLIPEASTAPSGFNNPYEHSKYVCEELVRDTLTRAGIAYRIFRPSVIIGHSVTHRSNGEFGFYKIIGRLSQLARTRGKGGPVTLPFKRDAILDLIPVDIVVGELLSLMAAGAATQGKIFHLTNERPLSVADVFFGVTPLTGLPLNHQPVSGQRRSPLDALVARGIRPYLPYLCQNREYDRGNVRAHGAGRLQARYRLDIVRLRAFAQTYLAQQAGQAAAVQEQRA